MAVPGTSLAVQEHVPVHVFVRQTSNSNGKPRPDWFSYEKCFKNLLSILDENAKLTVIFDGDTEGHFISKYPSVNLINIKEGTETKSFTWLVNHVVERDIKDDDIVYFVEDDYVHRPGSLDMIRDIFKYSNADYASLYDHADKYIPGYYQHFAQGFITHVVSTDKSHWRTTPSTTNTYAMKFSTLKRDIDIHLKFSVFEKVGKISQDHQKFCELWNSGKSLVTPIPGYSTHCEIGLMSPHVDWVKVLDETTDNV